MSGDEQFYDYMNNKKEDSLESKQNENSNQSEIYDHLDFRYYVKLYLQDEEEQININTKKQVQPKKVEEDKEMSSAKIQLIRDLLSNDRLQYMGFRQSSSYQQFVNSLYNKINSSGSLSTISDILGSNPLVAGAVQISQKKIFTDFLIEEVKNTKKKEQTQKNEQFKQELFEQIKQEFDAKNSIQGQNKSAQDNQLVALSSNENQLKEKKIEQQKEIDISFQNDGTKQQKNEKQINIIQDSQSFIDENPYLQASDIIDRNNLKHQKTQIEQIQQSFYQREKVEKSSIMASNRNISKMRSSKLYMSSSNKEIHDNANDLVDTLMQNLKKNDEFIPYISERTATGRSKIESIANLVTKIGAQNLIKKVTQQAKKNYKIEDNNRIRRNSLRGMGIIPFDIKQNLKKRDSFFQSSNHQFSVDDILMKTIRSENEAISEEESFSQENSEISKKNIRKTLNNSLLKEKEKNILDNESKKNSINRGKSEKGFKINQRFSKLIDTKMKQIKINQFQNDNQEKSSRLLSVPDSVKQSQNTYILKFQDSQNTNILSPQIDKIQSSNSNNIQDQNSTPTKNIQKTDLKQRLSMLIQNSLQYRSPSLKKTQNNQILTIKENQNEEIKDLDLSNKPQFKLNDAINDNIQSQLAKITHHQHKQITQFDHIQDVQLDKSDQEYFIQDLQNLKNLIKAHQNFSALSEQEQRMLKLMILNQKTDQSQKNKDKAQWFNKLNIDPDIANNASEENIGLIKHVSKVIMDRQLYKTQQLREFILQQKKLQNIKAKLAPIRKIKDQDGQQFATLSNVKSRNISQLRDLKSNRSLLTDRFGNIVLPVQHTIQTSDFKNKFSSIQNLSQSELRLVNSIPDQGTYFRNQSQDDYQQINRKNTLDSSHQKQGELLPISSHQLQQSYKQIKFPVDQKIDRSQHLIPKLKLKEINDNNFHHIQKNYEGDSFTNPVTRLSNIKSAQKIFKEAPIFPNIDHRSMSTLKLCKLDEEQKNYFEIIKDDGLNYDQLQQKREKIHGLQLQYQFSKNPQYKAKGSHLGEDVYIKMDKMQKQQQQNKIYRRELIMKYQHQQELITLQKNEEEALGLLQYSQNKNISKPVVHPDVTKELKDKYQWYCKYETDLTQKYSTIERDSHIFNKFVREKLNQFTLDKYFRD